MNISTLSIVTAATLWAKRVPLQYRSLPSDWTDFHPDSDFQREYFDGTWEFRKAPLNLNGILVAAPMHPDERPTECLGEEYRYQIGVHSLRFNSVIARNAFSDAVDTMLTQCGQF